MHANSAVSARPVAAIAALAMLLAAAPFAPNPRDAAAEAATMKTSVKISMFAFSPGVTTVPAGSSVTWTNNDDDAHSIVADNKAFRSAPLDTGDSYSFTFTTPGVYPYHCGLHPQMVGKIVVTR
jgi:plastocyanin